MVKKVKREAVKYDFCDFQRAVLLLEEKVRGWVQDTSIWMKTTKFEMYDKKNDDDFHDIYVMRFQNGERYAGVIPQHSSLEKKKYFARLTIDIPSRTPRTSSYILFPDRSLINKGRWYYFKESDNYTAPSLLTKDNFLYVIMKPLEP